MNEEVVHFYNVITGRITCGLNPREQPEAKYTVFETQVSCAACLNGKGGKSEGKGKKKAA